VEPLLYKGFPFYIAGGWDKSPTHTLELKLEGKEKDVGWGCVGSTGLRTLATLPRPPVGLPLPLCIGR